MVTHRTSSEDGHGIMVTHRTSALPGARGVGAISVTPCKVVVTHLEQGGSPAGGGERPLRGQAGEGS
eukprot:3080985-Pyramimonas_sp.AAC.1